MEKDYVTPGDIVRYVLIIALLIFFLFPIYWMIATSFKPNEAILSKPPTWFFQPTLDNYRYAFNESDFGLFLKNTLVVSITSTFFVIVFGSLASYSFARYDVGKGHLMFFILTTRMFPAVAVVLPYFIIFRNIGRSSVGAFLNIGLDTPAALIITYTMFNLPFAIWLMFSFFAEIPLELEDSARLDGYNRFQVFYKVVLPLAMPGIAVTAIFSLIFAWNEFLFAYMLTRDAARTVTVGVSSFWTQRGILWGPLSAAAVLAVVPMLIFALILQRYFVRGLTFGAVRG